MGILTAIFNGISQCLEFLFDKLPFFDLDFGILSDSLEVIKPYLEIANSIFPMKECIDVLSILIGYTICMVMFWGIQRAINLLRGCG